MNYINEAIHVQFFIFINDRELFPQLSPDNPHSSPLSQVCLLWLSEPEVSVIATPRLHAEHLEHPGQSQCR